MAILAKENSSGDFTPIPAETYLGRCVHVIELGNIMNERYGKMQRKVMIGFELMEDSIRYKNKDGDEVRPILYWEGTVSLGSNSAMRPLFETWFGKKMSAEALSGGFDVTKSVGHPGMIGVVHNVSGSNGKTYANIGGVGKPLVGITVPPAEHEYLVYEVSMLTGGTWPKVPDWIKKKIEDSAEFGAEMSRRRQQATPGTSTQSAYAPTAQGAPQAAMTAAEAITANPELVNDPTSIHYVKDSEAPF